MGVDSFFFVYRFPFSFFFCFVCENAPNMITRHHGTSIADRLSTLSLCFCTLFAIFGTRNYADGQAQPVQTQEQQLTAQAQATAPWYETLPAVAMDYKVIIDPGKEDCYFQFVNPGATFYASAQVRHCAPRRMFPEFFFFFFIGQRLVAGTEGRRRHGRFRGPTSKRSNCPSVPMESQFGLPRSRVYRRLLQCLHRQSVLEIRRKISKFVHHSHTVSSVPTIM